MQSKHTVITYFRMVPSNRYFAQLAAAKSKMTLSQWIRSLIDKELTELGYIRRGQSGWVGDANDPGPAIKQAIAENQE